MKNWRIGTCVVIVLFFTNSIFSQSETYGVVKDAKTGEALIGVTISIIGTELGTASDWDGKFRIKNDNKDLRFSYIGYEIKIIKNPNGLIEVGLQEDSIKLGVPLILKHIYVSDKRIRAAHNYSVLDKNILNLQNQAELSSILNTSSGVLMHSGALNTNRITIRGIGNRSPFSTNKIKAYLNEIPLTTGTGETTIEDIDLSFIKDIEIWKGPVGSRYGAGLGGMILLNTLGQEKEKSYFSLKNSIGSFGLLRNTMDGRLWDKEKELEIHLNLNSTQSDGYRDNNKYDRKGITLLANKKFKENQLSFLINYTSLKAFIPSSLNEDDYLNAPTKAAFTWGNVKGFEDYNKILAGVSFEQKIKKDFKLNYALFLNQKDSYESRPFNILDEKSNSIGGRVVGQGIFDNLFKGTTFRIGTEVFRENYDWQTFVTNDGIQGNELSNNEETRSYANIFGESIFRFDNNLKLNVGLNFNTTKYDLIDQFNVDSLNLTGDYTFDPIFSPRLTFSYSPSRHRDYYVMMSHGFAPPSLEETLAPDGSINTTIQPETAWNFEIGTRYYPPNFNKKMLYEFSLFTMRVNDLLVARRTALDQYVGINAGKTTHSGLEAHINYRLLMINTYQLNLAVNYTYSNFKFKEFIDDEDDFSGNELTGSAPHNLNAILFFKYKKFYSNLNFQFVDSQPLTDANTVYSDAYSLLNFKLGHKFHLAKQWEFDLYTGLNNILNEKYASMHQINASSFGGNAPRYYYPGLPRNYYVGLDLKYSF